MKYLLLSSVLLTGFAFAGTYAPNDGTAKPGNPGATINNPGPRANGTAYSNDAVRTRSEEITERTGVSTSELNPSPNPVPSQNASESFEKTTISTEKNDGLKKREIQAQESRTTKPVGQ